MLYATMAFWLMIIVLSAWGVYQIWCGLVKPKIVNVILLPGTLVAQMGHVLGLLVTGATVTNTTLVKDDETAAPEQTRDAKPRIPVIGPVIIGLLPLITCAVAIFLAANLLGGPTVDELTKGRVSTSLPLSLAAFWELLRSQITLMETTLAAALQCAAPDWRALLFIYLLVCLTVRMAPFPGTTRGSLGAIVLLGILAALFGLIITQTDSVIDRGWNILSLSVTTLLLLLLFSLLVLGLVSLVRVVSRSSA